MCHQNVGQNRSIKVDNKSVESVAQFIYLETAVTNKNLIQEEIKIRLNSTLTEEHRLRVFEDRVLRRIFGPKRHVIIGSWRKVHSDGLYNFLPNIIRMIKLMRCAGHAVCMGARRSFGRKISRKETTTNRRRRLEDNIKIEKYNEEYGRDSSGSGLRPVAGSC
jgi:hypothetical protein